MLVQWYWREHEFVYFPNKSRPKFVHEREVLLNTSDIGQDLEVKSVITTCAVRKKMSLN